MIGIDFRSLDIHRDIQEDRAGPSVPGEEDGLFQFVADPLWLFNHCGVFRDGADDRDDVRLLEADLANGTIPFVLVGIYLAGDKIGRAHV